MFGLALAYVAIVGGVCLHKKPEGHGFGELVDIPVTISSNNFWDIRNQKDSDGDKLMSDDAPGWYSLISDVSLVNERKKSESLADVIKRNGYVSLPEKYVNSAYDFKSISK